jgi:hypothetical protein
VLLLAREMGLLQLGTVALDGTKIHANASRHKALSYERAGRLEAQLKAEVGGVVGQGRSGGQGGYSRRDVDPGGTEAADERLKKTAEALSKIEARARERFAREQADHEAKIAAREAKAKARGRKPGGRPPAPPTEGPGPSDQVNLTDDDPRIMPVAGGGFEQCYNAQAVVTADSLLVVAADVVQAANDKQQLKPSASSGSIPAAAQAATTAHRITRPWTSALPRHRRHGRTRRRSKPWRTAWPRPKVRGSTLGASAGGSRHAANGARR